MTNKKKRERNVRKTRLVSKEAERKEPERKLEVYSPRDRLQGEYSNFAIVQHTKREFVFDFIWRLQNYSALVSRIITSPEHVRELYVALGRNIERYENKFGKIEIGEAGKDDTKEKDDTK